MNSTITSLARREAIKDTKSSKEEETEPTWKYAPFPDNVGKLIPTEYYSQFEKWYSVMRKLQSAYTEQDIVFCKIFKFCFDLRVDQKQRGGGTSYDGNTARCGGGNCKHNRASRTFNNNWRNERNTRNFSPKQVHRGDLDRNGRFSRSNGRNSYGDNLNTSSRRTAVHTHSPGHDLSADEDDYDNFLF